MAAEGMLLRVKVPGTTPKRTMMKRECVNAAATMPRSHRPLRLRRLGRMRGESGRRRLVASLTREGGGGRAQIDCRPHHRIRRATTVTALLRDVGTAAHPLIGSNNNRYSSNSSNGRNGTSSGSNSNSSS
jgi:hypothetical protein